jgi:hypothetical protein
MTATRLDTHEELSVAASELAGETIAALVPAGHGANSRVFRVDLPTRRLALKSYPERRGDARDRLETEWTALHFFRSRGLLAVPTPIARDAKRRLMLMEWIGGENVAAHGRSDLEDAISFVVRIFDLSRDAGIPRFASASEACFSPAEILRQIDARLSELRRHPMLAAFFEDELLPALAVARSIVGADAGRSDELAPGLRRLIPADFGFHNALRQSDGRLRFFDFDYFGWDDPVKLTVDFILHPAMNLSEGDKALVVERMAAALADDRSFTRRLGRHLPLYAVRWALILLNPFRADRHDALPADQATRQQLLAGQIEKARAMCGLAASHSKASQTGAQLD